jgi:hypothetical protein
MVTSVKSYCSNVCVIGSSMRTCVQSCAGDNTSIVLSLRWMLNTPLGRNSLKEKEQEEH